MILTGSTILDQSGPGSNGNNGVVHTPYIVSLKSSEICERVVQKRY